MQRCALPTLDCYVLQSVFHVSYLRGLFDENSFTTRDMDNLDGDSPRLWSPDDVICWMHATIAVPGSASSDDEHV
jgi:hypothetical protein